jgi:hypothetical protein
MREIRLSGSEGGGGGASPYPYSTHTELARDAISVSKHPMQMAGQAWASPAMTGLAARVERQ